MHIRSGVLTFAAQSRSITMEIVTGTGRPADCSGRLDKEIAAYDFLDSIGITYMRADHAEAFDMETCDAVAEALGTEICKNLFLCNRQQTVFHMLLMPGDKKFKTKDISAQIGSSRLSFADEAHMESMLNLTPGSVTILGLMFDPEKKVHLVIDEDLLTGHDSIGLHPCINTSSVRISMDDFRNKLIPALGHEPTIVSLPRYEE